MLIFNNNILKPNLLATEYSTPQSKYRSVSSLYIWSENFSHSAYERSEAKMAAIDVQ
jgi:hypothetical protein